VECAAGSMLVFDSTLWHAAGAKCLRERPSGDESPVHAIVHQAAVTMLARSATTT